MGYTPVHSPVPQGGAFDIIKAPFKAASSSSGERDSFQVYSEAKEEEKRRIAEAASQQQGAQQTQATKKKQVIIAAIGLVGLVGVILIWRSR